MHVFVFIHHRHVTLTRHSSQLVPFLLSQVSGGGVGTGLGVVDPVVVDVVAAEVVVALVVVVVVVVVVGLVVVEGAPVVP